MDESLSILAQVVAKVERIAFESTSPGLTEEESIFLSNVRDSVPQILDFTRRQFQWAVEAGTGRTTTHEEERTDSVQSIE